MEVECKEKDVVYFSTDNGPTRLEIFGCGNQLFDDETRLLLSTFHDFPDCENPSFATSTLTCHYRQPPEDTSDTSILHLEASTEQEPLKAVAERNLGEVRSGQDPPPLKKAKKTVTKATKKKRRRHL